MSAMKYTILLLSILFACNTSSTKNRVEEKEIKINKPSISYDTTLIKVNHLKKECQRLDPYQAGVTFSNFVDTNLFPYWYGTPWDYNGVTQTPNEGYIACGYFVTTLLRDAGVKLERVKLAQMASEDMIKILCKKESIKRYHHTKIGDFISSVKKQGYGLYVVGLDLHTGFVLCDSSQQVYFIHSSGIPPYCVVKEDGLTSPLLINSAYRVLGKLD